MIEDLSGKRIVITGANSGIARVAAQELARRGADLVLCCRSQERTKPVLDAIQTQGGVVEFCVLDLADLDSVRRCAEQVLIDSRPISVLINNAGFAGARGLSAQGVELTFAVNHLGHFLLTQLLLPRLLAAGKCRVVNVSSTAHFRVRGIDFEALRRSTASLTGFPEYAVSKLANVLHAKELARRYAERGLHSYALHPGVVNSNVWRHVPQPARWLIQQFMISNEQGARTTLYVATSPDVEHDNGLYYDGCQQKAPSGVALDAALAAELWRRSEQWTAPV